MARDPEVGQAVLACRSARAEPGPAAQTESRAGEHRLPHLGSHPRSGKGSRICEQFPERKLKAHRLVDLALATFGISAMALTAAIIGGGTMEASTICNIACVDRSSASL